ncbi:hypothetical protein Pmani_008708 [Petrolisthes manimaculis]|uniref:Uncharacterized protein n=1 Tax=Petrolisthes manimaculis TaxID=1843537 RepID=A0AAE1UJA6_9EUCA|nr:hypothetical protein Pmani_009682 [Petrolisthes manimaculis]KAK4320434.1 hypothetical protein Pmani_008708 [Petrolisthes manimaculis]
MKGCPQGVRDVWLVLLGVGRELAVSPSHHTHPPSSHCPCQHHLQPHTHPTSLTVLIVTPVTRPFSPTPGTIH